MSNTPYSAYPAYHEYLPFWKDLLSHGLKEDRWQWDWTTLGTLNRADQKLQARIIAKSAGIWAASGLNHGISCISGESGHPVMIKSKVIDGESLKPGDLICEWEGPARWILAFERTYLNLASYVSGIATQTAKLVELVQRASSGGGRQAPRVSATRKILPYYRDLALYGLLVGGGYGHRLDLAAGVLIKENHIVSGGGVAPAVESARKIVPHGLRVEIEVRSEQELSQALLCKADGILLDNFKPDQVKSAIQAVRKAGYKPTIEVSGGISAENIVEYAIDGVDVISVGSLTHSVRALDLSLLVH